MKASLFLYIPLLGLSLSCGNQQGKKVAETTEKKSEVVSNIPFSSTDIVENTTENQPIAVEDNLVEIKFDEFTLEIDSLYIWQEEEFSLSQQDTAEVYLELGEMIEGQTLKIKQLKEGRLRVHQRFENSVTIMAEGPHCDLTEWLHYDSEWNELPIRNGEFLTNSYTMEQRELFRDITVDELKTIVREQCGEDWAKQIENVKSVTEYPAGVGTSRVFLRFTLEEANQTTERFISFVIPMGC